jgi:hypothetical protein
VDAEAQALLGFEEPTDMLGRDAAAWPVGMAADVRGFGCVTALVKALAI